MMRRLLRTAAAIAVLVGVILVLHAAARFDLRGPTGLSSGELTRWFDDPVRALATIARWIALMFAYYLLVIVGAVSLLGERLDERRIARFLPADLVATIGILLGVAAVGVPLASHMAETPAAMTTPPADPASPLQLVELDAPLELSLIRDTSSHPMTDAFATSTQAAQVLATESWTVAAGDSFWSIAEETLAEAWDRTDLTDAEIASYWRTLISANEDQLVQPGNPDLLLPGQTLVVPPPPGQ